MQSYHFKGNWKEVGKLLSQRWISHWVFLVCCLSGCISGRCHACRSLSLIETNVDTSHPRNCSQLTGCLIKVIHWFICGRTKALAKWARAARARRSGPLRVSPFHCQHLERDSDDLDSISVFSQDVRDVETASETNSSPAPTFGSNYITSHKTQ